LSRNSLMSLEVRFKRVNSLSTSGGENNSPAAVLLSERRIQTDIFRYQKNARKPSNSSPPGPGFADQSENRPGGDRSRKLLRPSLSAVQIQAVTGGMLHEQPAQITVNFIQPGLRNVYLTEILADIMIIVRNVDPFLRDVHQNHRAGREAEFSLKFRIKYLRTEAPPSIGFSVKLSVLKKSARSFCKFSRDNIFSLILW